MKLACPQCGSRDARVSHRAGAAEWFRSLIGIFPLRCRRCPKCYRQQLSTWNEEHYSPPRWTLLQLRLGATPYRCVSCRCNFASFKKCKGKFTWHHQDRNPGDRDQTPPEVESDSALKH